ncbi:MAG: hypothetical protein M0Q46_06235 [Endomicrobiales bacterium]|nr:hypothetical protein [Endomicrobiales bacterium]
MALKTNAIITLDELKSFLEIQNADIQTAFLTIYNAASGATAATVQVTATALLLVVTGGASAGTSTLTFSETANDTLMELVVAINALGKGWVANIQGYSGESSVSLTVKEATSCLLVANILTLYGTNNYRLETYINAVSDFIERETGQTFKSLTYTNDEQDGNGYPLMWLNHFPVISLSALSYYDRYSAATLQTLTQDTDFYLTLSSGKIEPSSGVWTKGVRNIRATYIAGYSIIPDDIKLLCMQIVELRINKRGKSGLTAVTIGRYSETFTKEALPIELQSELDKFKRVIF